MHISLASELKTDWLDSKDVTGDILLIAVFMKLQMHISSAKLSWKWILTQRVQLEKQEPVKTTCPAGADHGVYLFLKAMVTPTGDTWQMPPFKGLLI